VSRLTVAKALTLPALRGTRVLAGANGLDRIIECATVMEVPNITRWLRGNELVITSLYALRESPEEQVRLIADLDQVGIAALLIKPKVYVDRLPDRMLQEADARAMPVLELPVETPYIDVLNAVMAEVFRRSSVHRYEADMVEDLLAGVIADPAQLQARAEEVGWNPQGGAVAAVIHIDPPQERGVNGGVLSRLCDRVADEVRAAVRGGNGLVAASGSRVRVVLASGREGVPVPRSLARSLLQSVQQDLARRGVATLSIGIGVPVDGYAALPDSYRTACRCVDLGRRLWGPGRLVMPDDVAIYHVLEAIGPGGGPVTGAAPTALPLHPGLQRLLEYDAANKAQLVPTLRCVLDEQGNLRRAAGRLFVHYKTVQYRMARIRELTGWDLSRPELRLAIEVQLRWLDLHSDRAE